MIKGLIFDLYDTLIYLELEIFREYKRNFARFFNSSPEEVSHIWKKYTDKRFSGEIKNIREMIEIVIQELGVESSSVDVEAAELHDIAGLCESVREYPGATKMLETLKSEGYKLALLSNASYQSRFVLDKLSFINLFDSLIISYEIGLVKPDPAIYALALEKLGLLPDECLFVGDGGSMELDGAIAVGIPAVKVAQFGQDPSYERSERYDYVIDSITDLPDLIKKIKTSSGGRHEKVY